MASIQSFGPTGPSDKYKGIAPGAPREKDANPMVGEDAVQLNFSTQEPAAAPQRSPQAAPAAAPQAVVANNPALTVGGLDFEAGLVGVSAISDQNSGTAQGFGAFTNGVGSTALYNMNGELRAGFAANFS